MKQIYAFSSCLALALAASTVSAQEQQLPNADFEQAWEDCVPWTFYQDEEHYGQPSAVVTGTNPQGWTISNVSGMVSVYEDAPSGLGATVVGDSVAGFESDCAVKLTNTPNPFNAAQIVPGYLTLGTTWSTAIPTFSMAGIEVKNSDGGVFGGISFNKRPTGIEFMYKRARGTDKPDEKSTVVAYLWKGHWTQKAVPSTICMVGDPYAVDMVDRDRCVLGLGMAGCQGGEVTRSEDAELIAVINADITEVSEDWVKFSANFEYKSDATPEMFNLVIAAGDYFGGASVVGNGNSITIDDVKLIYDGEPQPAADKYPGKLTIEMGGEPLTEEPMDAELSIAYTATDKCTLTLPNFTLDMGSGPTNLGDIVVPDVNVALDGNVAKYTGRVDGMKLMGGMIVADVVVEGTIDTAGKAAFKINVMWQNIPIDVTFNGEGKPAPGTTGVSIVDNDPDAPALYYDLNGVKVSSANLTPGIYIKRQGGKTVKVVVR